MEEELLSVLMAEAEKRATNGKSPGKAPRERELLPCKWCGKPVPYDRNKGSRSNKYFCSVNCCTIFRNKWMSSRDNNYSRNYTKKSDSTDSVIRQHARKELQHLPKICRSCGYEKYVEIHHIRPLRDFSGDAIVGEINALDNLIALCRNCHWELDKGHISIDHILNKPYPLYGMFK